MNTDEALADFEAAVLAFDNRGRLFDTTERN